MKTYLILYVVQKRGINFIEETVCESDQLEGVIRALQGLGYEIHVVIGSTEPF